MDKLRTKMIAKTIKIHKISWMCGGFGWNWMVWHVYGK